MLHELDLSTVSHFTRIKYKCNIPVLQFVCATMLLVLIVFKSSKILFVQSNFCY
jgi:hypothetical protein